MLISRKVFTSLVVIALLVPMLVLVLTGTGKLLAAMGDAAGAGFLDRLALAGGILWGLDLLLLLLALGVNAAADSSK